MRGRRRNGDGFFFFFLRKIQKNFLVENLNRRSTNSESRNDKNKIKKNLNKTTKIKFKSQVYKNEKEQIIIFLNSMCKR